MRGLTRGRLLALLLVLAVSLGGAACGGGGGGGDGGNGEDTSDEGGGGDDEGGGGGDEGGGGEDDDGGGSPGAVVSPLKIPAIEQVGAPIGDVRASITDRFVDACGGELCVELAEVDANGGTVTDECVFSRTDPGRGTEVQRGSTVTLVLRCEGGGSGGEESGSGEEGEEGDATTEEPGTGDGEES